MALLDVTELFEDPDFANDPRYDTAAKRRASESELGAILLPRLSQYTKKESSK